MSAPSGAPRGSHMTAAQWATLLTLAVMWGSSFFFTRVAVDGGVPVVLVVFGRLSLAAVVLWWILHLEMEIPRRAEEWVPMVMVGFFGSAFPFMLLTWAQKYVASGEAAILVAATPLFTVLLSSVFSSGERITANRLIGVLVGIAGVTLMVGPGALKGIGQEVIPKLMILGTAMSYSVSTVYVHIRGRGGLPAEVSTAWALLLASAFLVIPAIPAFPALVEVSATAIVAVVMLSLGSTALGFFLFFRLVASAGGTNFSLVTLLTPVIALSLGAAILDEEPPWTAFAGMGLIFAGLICVDGRLLARIARSRHGSRAGVAER